MEIVERLLGAARVTLTEIRAVGPLIVRGRLGDTQKLLGSDLLIRSTGHGTCQNHGVERTSSNDRRARLISDNHGASARVRDLANARIGSSTIRIRESNEQPALSRLLLVGADSLSPLPSRRN